MSSVFVYQVGFSQQYNVADFDIPFIQGENIEFLYISDKDLCWLGSLNGPIVNAGNNICNVEFNQFSKSLREGNIQSPFLEDENHDLWFSTTNYLYRYISDTNKFSEFSLKEKGDEDYWITIFYIENGKWLWGVSNYKLFKVDISQAELNPIWLHDDVRSIRFDVSVNEVGTVEEIVGAKWAFGEGIEVFDVSEGSVEKSTYMDYDNSISKHVKVVNKKAFLSTNKGLKIFNLELMQYECIDFPNLLMKSIRAQIQLLPSNELLIGTFDGDIFSYDFLTNKVNKIFIKEEGSKKLISVTFKYGTVWYSLMNEGVFRFNFFPNKSILSIEKSSSIKRFTTHKGYIYWRNDDEEVYMINYTNGDLVDSLSRRLTDNSLTYWDEFNFSHAVDKKLFSEFNNVIALSDFGGSKLIDIKNNQVIFEYDNIINALFFLEDLNNECFLWGNRDFILAHRTSNLDTPIHELNERVYKTHATLDTLRNCYWITTARGLLQLDRTTFQPTWLTEATHDLPAIWYQAVAIDEYQNLWLSSNQGIYHYKPDDKADPITHYTDRDGLTSNEYNMGATITDSLGRIWFGSTKGVDIIDPSKVGEKSPPPKLMITELMIFDKPYEGDRSIMVEDAIELPYYHNTLTVEMAALHYADPERNTYYAYMRGDGQAADTIDYKTQNKVTYVNLDPGHYQFGFTAANPEGVKNPVYKTLDIYIVPPYWQTWWFRTLVVLAIASLLFGAIIAYYRYRLREQKFQLEKQQIELRNELSLQKERNRIANEMHDDLGGKLSTILFAGKRMRRSKSLEEANTVMERVNKISLELIDSMKSIIWAMDSENDDLDSLLSIIRNVATKFGYDNELSMKVDIPETYPDTQLRGAVRHNVLLSVKEALNNALKHANASQLDLQIELSTNQLHINIQDNGAGFDYATALGKGKGLRNMKRRIESIGGQIEWIALERGVCVQIIVPIGANENLNDNKN